jgi:hypothetical protein
MKYLLLAFATFVIVSCNKPVKGTNGVTYKNPVQYNDYIVSRQSQLMQKVIDFGKAAETSLDSAENLLRGYVKETDVMIGELKGMPPYKNDSTLRDAAIRSFSFYKRVFAQDYMDIIAIRKKDNITDSDVSEMGRIVDKITREEEGFDKAFHNAQRDFAERNNMKLRENEMQKKVDEMDKKSN